MSMVGCFSAESIRDQKDVLFIEDLHKRICLSLLQREFLALGAVCQKFRQFNFSIRPERTLKLHLDKKLETEEDFVSFRNSGFGGLRANSKNVLLQTPSYIQYLTHVTELYLVPMSNVQVSQGANGQIILKDVTNQPSKKSSDGTKRPINSVLDVISSLRNLRSLDLSNNKLYSGDLKGILSLTSIECLDLSLNVLDDNLVKGLAGKLHNLKRIKLELIKFDNKITVKKVFDEKLPNCELLM